MLEGGKRAVCANCGVIFEQEDDIQVKYPKIPGLLNRMEPGGEVPVGECPFCGALVYLDKTTESKE